jgi:hypothetical protein
MLVSRKHKTVNNYSIMTNCILFYQLYIYYIIVRAHCCRVIVRALKKVYSLRRAFIDYWYIAAESMT